MEISLLILKRITRSVGREVEKVGAKVKGGGSGSIIILPGGPKFKDNSSCPPQLYGPPGDRDLDCPSDQQQTPPPK